MGSAGLKYCNSVFGREAHGEDTKLVKIVIPGRKLAIKMARAQKYANQVTAPSQALDGSLTTARRSAPLISVVLRMNGRCLFFFEIHHSSPLSEKKEREGTK